MGGADGDSGAGAVGEMATEAGTAPAATLDGLHLLSGPGVWGGFAMPLEASPATNGALVGRIAARADAWAARKAFGGNARQVGTAKHAYAMNLLKRYQHMFGPRGLLTEVSYRQGQRVEYGTCGSARLDVIDVRTREIWDYKFGARGLSPAQRLKILIQGPAGALVREVRP